MNNDKTFVTSQTTKSHAGRERRYKPQEKPWIIQYCLSGNKKKEKRKRKVLLFYTFSTGHHQFPPPFQPKRKNGDMRKKETDTGRKKN